MAKLTTRPPTRTYAHITRTPGVLGGEPRIKGHRIPARDIVAARDLGGLSPEEIAASVYPHLTLAQAYAALAYYEDHREELTDIRGQKSDSSKSSRPSIPASCSTSARTGASRCSTAMPTSTFHGLLSRRCAAAA